MTSARRTTDHQKIVQWVEERGGHPAHVRRTGDTADPGILRIDFPGHSGEQSLEPLDWDSWFDAFEANQLAFLHQDRMASGETSHFSKLVRRTRADELAGAQPHRHGTRRRGRTTVVDLNTASEEELVALWGIGPANARKIVEFRREHGRLQSPDDLAKIDGIDGATVAVLRGHVSV